MKKFLVAVISALLAICFLSACVPTVEEISSKPIMPSSNPVVESSSASPSESPPGSSIALPTEPSSEPSGNPVFNIADEPPLDERSLSIAVPDFLNEEQQLLYRKAYRLYEAMFGGSSSGIDIPHLSGQPTLPSVENATIAYAGNDYVVSTGRYSDWNNFSMVIYSVYTDEFWKYMNQFNGVERYINVDGRMCYLDLGRGSGRLYLGQPDEFELVSRTDDSIIFTLIGHYRQTIEDNGNGKSYTIRFPMKMLNTTNGWRFDEFHSALWEQQILDE